MTGLPPSCQVCKRSLAMEESAWANEWLVVDEDGPRRELRYVCDDCSPATCPECDNGKHVNCTGWAIDEVTDAVTSCACPEATHPWNKNKERPDERSQAADPR